ncbi:MAG: hypothetical protein COA69_03900 [Robiginitomaculum sp.]|nr:MAG: hypothetical protein COA69_03900 [Robiginitomaculum sp.]
MGSFDGFEDPLKNNRKLEQAARFRDYTGGEVILSEVDQNNCVYFILSGRVKITSFSPSGREVWHNELGHGKTFGEMAAVSGKSRSASVIAIEATRVGVVSKNDFLAILHDSPEISIWLIEELVERLSLSTHRVYELVSQSIPLRIRVEVLRLCKLETDQVGEVRLCPIPNFSELAKRVNADRESVSREISSLVKKGILKRDKKCLIVLDQTFLAETTAINLN